MAWLGRIETGSILIKEKRKHISKMSDRVSRNVFRMEVLEVRNELECLSLASFSTLF
jgi:hypothetical protein